MPLESGTVISDLVVTNPAHTDGLNQADAHMRLLKNTIKTTFPNITGAVTATQAQLNGLAGWYDDGVSRLATIVLDDTYSNGFTFTDVHTINVKIGGVVKATFTDNTGFAFTGNIAVTGNETISGDLTVTGKIKGPGSVPIGAMIIWLDDTLPTDGNWCWANGGTLSRTTVGGGKELWDMWGSRYGAGNGSTTFNVINMQEVVPVGKSGMGSGTPPGLLPSISAGVKDALNGLFGADTKTLQTTNLPAYTPAGTVTTTLNTGTTGNNGTTKTMARVISGSTGPLGYGGTATGGDYANADITASSSWSGSPQGGNSTAFGLSQPSRVVNYVIRIA
jgi:microcystin-dependent protein